MRAEAQILRALIQSAFVVRLAGLYESPLNSVLVTEYLAGGDLVTRYLSSLSTAYIAPVVRTAQHDYCLTERKCQIFIRQVSIKVEQDIIKTLKNRSNGITNAAIFFCPDLSSCTKPVNRFH